jgi:hypothetical protein
VWTSTSRLTTSNNVVVTDLGSNALGGGSQVGESKGDGEVTVNNRRTCQRAHPTSCQAPHSSYSHLAVLDGVGTNGQSLVNGDKVTVLHSRVGDGTSGGVVGESGELGEGQGGVGLGAASDEAERGGVDGREGDGGILGNGPGVSLEDSRADPSLMPGLGGQDRSCQKKSERHVELSTTTTD